MLLDGGKLGCEERPKCLMGDGRSAADLWLVSRDGENCCPLLEKTIDRA